MDEISGVTGKRAAADRV